MLRAAKSLLLASSLFLFSCEKWLVDTPPPYPSSFSRILFYLHSTLSAPTDVTFTISEIKLETDDNQWMSVMDSPIDINSTTLADRQILLKDAAVRPGAYRNIKIIISRASIKRRDGSQANLALPQPGGEVVIKSNIRLREKESSVFSLLWDPEKSIEKDYRFQPSIEGEPQRPSAAGLLLFISNSASNYISIIDRSLERVVGAATVGERPMGMALNSVQDRLYVVNSGSNSVSVIDVAHFTVIDTIPLTAGMGPTDVAIMPDANNLIDGKLYIVNRLSNDVTVVSPTARRVLKTIAVGVSPSAIAADPARREVYVTNELSNNLSIISTVTDSLIANITLDTRPTGLVVAEDRVYVFNEGSNRISVVSLSSREVTGYISLEGPPKRGMRGFGNRLFVANSAVNTITFLNSADVVTRTIPAGAQPTGFAGDEKRNRLYITNYGANTVSVVDPIGEKVLKELFVGRNPYGAALLER